MQQPWTSDVNHHALGHADAGRTDAIHPPPQKNRSAPAAPAQRPDAVQPSAPVANARTAAGGRLVGGVREDNSMRRLTEVATIQYDRPMTEQQVREDLVRHRETDIRLLPDPSTQEGDRARRWRVSLPNENAFFGLRPEALQTIMSRPFDPEGRVDADMMRRIRSGHIPEGAREIRPNVHLWEGAPGNLVYIDRRRSEPNVQVFRQRETSESMIQQRSFLARNSSDPELFSRLTASINREFNQVAQHYIREDGLSPRQAEARASRFLSHQARRQIAAWAGAILRNQPEALGDDE